jgi:two-component sensor histidine kinase
MASLEPAGESEEEKLKRLSDRLKALMTTHDKLLVTSEAKAPFYTEDLYESVETCLRAAVKEINSVRKAGKDALRMDGYVEASQNNETFSEGYIKSVRIIRNRISRLAILPGN